MGPLPKVAPKPSKGKTTATTTTTNASKSTKLPTITSPSSKTADKIAVEITADKVAVEEAIRLEEEQKKAKVEEELKKAEEELRKVEEAIRLEEERKKRENGTVTLIYEQYNEKFDISDGSTTSEAIDEVYCLSFVMPNCKIQLSVFSPTDKRKLDETGNIDVFVKEEPEGTYLGLASDCTYYVYVVQEAEQLSRDQERMRRIAEGMEGSKKPDDGIIKPDDGRGMESCSCLYGNPCVDEYGCKDWGNRYAIAMANGWKGF